MHNGTSCPVCGTHIRDGETCENCESSMTRDFRPTKPDCGPKGGKKKHGGGKKIPKTGKK